MSKLARAMTLLLLVAPYLILVQSSISQKMTLQFSDIEPVILATLLQCFLSATLAVFFGFLGSLGLLAFPHIRWLTGFVLLPNFVPTLFVVLSLLNLWNPFPFGLVGVVLLQVMINAGLVAVNLTRSIETKMSGFAELAIVDGASPLFFWLRGGLRFLRSDLTVQFILVFSICLSSFVIPVLVGGGKAFSLEVLIYERVRLYGDLSSGLLVGLIQTSFLILALVIFRIEASPPRSEKNYNFTAMSFRWGLALLCLPVGCIFLGLLGGLRGSLNQLASASISFSTVAEPTINTVFLAISTGFTTALMLLLIALGLPNSKFHRTLMFFATPSSILVGFSLLLLKQWLFGSTATMTGANTLTVCGLTLTFLPVFYRLKWAEVIASLRLQREVAATLGADGLMSMNRIVLPQVSQTLGYLGGIAAFWTCGEVAICGMIIGGNYTLSLFIQGLMGTYRLEAATLLTCLMLAIGCLLFGLFWGIGNVIGQKSHA